MHTFNKIGKTKNITYSFGVSRENSKDGMIFADFTKHEKGRDQINSFTNQVVAWINLKSKEILWDEESEHLIDKNYIKSFVITQL